MKRKFLFVLCILFSLLLIVTSAHAYLCVRWNSKSASCSGLTDVGDRSNPEICFNCTRDGNWTLISGNSAGTFSCFYWSGSAWTAKSASCTGLPDVGTRSAPAVCNNCTGDGNWTLIAGNSTDMVNAFYWNGTQWVLDTTRSSGLPIDLTYPRPYICNNCTGDNRWTLIYGQYDGTFGCYYWTGSAWASIGASCTGLGDVGLESRPYACDNCTGDGRWTFISGEEYGTFLGYYWNGTQWVSDSSRVYGLGDIGSCSRPSICNNCVGDGKWTLVSGNLDGTFNCFYMVGEVTNTQYRNQASNVSVVAMGGGVNLSVEMYAECALKYAILSTNESTVWENKTTYNSPMSMGDVVDWALANFSYVNSSFCDRVVGWRVYFNDSANWWNSTPVLTFTQIPYCNATAGVRSGISSTSCANTTHFQITWSQVTTGYIEAWLPYHTVDSTNYCDYEFTDGYNFTVYNLTDYCYAKAYLKDIAANDVTHFRISIPLRVAPPSNLPAALGAAMVGLIIVIYVITTRRE